MPIKKIEIQGLHQANPIVEVIASVNENLDAIVEAFKDVNGGVGVVGETGAKGDRGDMGPAGIQGPQGEQGLPGPKGDTGEQGPQGEPGKDGINGKDGKDGVDGKDGKDGRDGAVGPQGEQGIQGEPGPKGDKGEPGIPGAAGAKGETGAQGIQGLPGKDGKDGAVGAQGIQGLKGDTGATGATGAQGPAGVGIKGFASGYVDAGQFVTLDNLKFTVTTGGARGLSCATVSGSVNLMISGTFGYVNGVGGSATTQNYTYTTTPSGSWFGWSFPNQGDGSTYLVNDTTNYRFYRVTLMIGPGYSKNFISIERLI